MVPVPTPHSCCFLSSFDDRYARVFSRDLCRESGVVRRLLLLLMRLRSSNHSFLSVQDLNKIGTKWYKSAQLERPVGTKQHPDPNCYQGKTTHTEILFGKNHGAPCVRPVLFATPFFLCTETGAHRCKLSDACCESWNSQQVFQWEHVQ